MSAKTGCFALLISLFTLPAFADNCVLTGKINLDRDVVIRCTQGENLILAKELHLITNGHRVEFQVEREIINQGAKIDVVDPDQITPVELDARPIVFNAETVSGTCGYIHNNGHKNGAGGDVIFQNVLSYKSELNGDFKCADITVAGAGQGVDAQIIAFADFGRIPFTEFAARVMN